MSKPFALSDEARHFGASSTGSFSKRLEIDVRGEILFARGVQNRRMAMTAHRLERVAGSAALVAIVDDQGNAAMRRDAPGNTGDGLVADRRRFHDLAVAVEGEPAGRNHDSAFDPADMLADRQGVEELVG